MYYALKHSHFIMIALSALLFTIRYVLLVKQSTLLQNKVIKIAPHAVDTLLILTGIGLILYTGFIPYTDAAPWMAQKLTCVFAYFALCFFTLKLAKNNLLRTFGFLGAHGWLVMASNVAISKVGTLLG